MAGKGESGLIDMIMHQFDVPAEMLGVGADCAVRPCAGEDYELLFTAPPGIETLVDFPIYQIGEIMSGNSLIWMENGNAVNFDVKGFNHF